MTSPYAPYLNSYSPFGLHISQNVKTNLRFKENDPSVPIKRREEKVFRLEKRSLTFINDLSFFAMDIDSCSWTKRKLNEGRDARLFIIRDSMARCLATRFCLTPNQYVR